MIFQYITTNKHKDFILRELPIAMVARKKISKNCRPLYHGYEYMTKNVEIRPPPAPHPFIQRETTPTSHIKFPIRKSSKTNQNRWWDA